MGSTLPVRAAPVRTGDLFQLVSGFYPVLKTQPGRCRNLPRRQ